MTKSEYIELIQRNLAGGEVVADVKGIYHENVVALYIAIAFNSALWELVKVSQATRDSSTLDQYIKTFDISKSNVQCDDKSGLFFIYTPSDMPQVIGGQAIRYVGSSKKNSRGYLYRNPTGHDVFNELDVNLVDQSPRFSPEDDKIFLYNILEVDFPEYFRVKMITSFEDYDNDDSLPMPGGKDIELFPAIIQLIRSQSKEDLINDNRVDNEIQRRR